MGEPSDSRAARRPPILRMDRVTKVYPDGTVAVGDVSLEIPHGAFFVLVGPGGAGKTTLLRVIARLLAPTTGTVTLAGRDIARLDAVAYRRRVTYVTGGTGLIQSLTVGENIAFVLRLLGVPRTRRRDRAAELLHAIGFDPAVYLDRPPAALTRAERQWIAVLRALADHPDLVLVDEPFGTEPEAARRIHLADLKRLQQTVGVTVLAATRNPEAARLGDATAFLQAGRLAAAGCSELAARAVAPVGGTMG